VRPRSLALALGLWVRWLRVPIRFSTLFALVVVVAVALFGAVADPGTLPLVVGGVLVFAGTYVSGGLFGLNPLGEAGEMRVIETLSATPPRTLVLGHVLAGLLVGTPLATAGSVLLAVTLGLPTLPAVAGVLLAVLLTLVSGSVAVAIGSVVPSPDAERTYRGYAVATPSQWALIGYMLAVVSLLVLAGVSALMILLASDPGTTGPLVVAGALVAAGALTAVGYAGIRVATGRFGVGPSRDTGGAREAQGGNIETDESAATGTLAGTSLSRTQQHRGLVLLGAFVVLRAVLARAWDRYFPGGYSTDPLFLAFLGGIFLLLSVGLVYLGFTRWVGVDLQAWWVDRRRLRGDVGWGVVGIVLTFVATIGGTLALTVVLPGLGSIGAAGADPAPTVAAGASGLAVNLLLGWFFGFAIAAFQEETLFRGFLQTLLQERYGRLVAIVGQAAVFALAHLGYYPVSAWPLIVVVFLVGIVTGWLVDRRGTLLPAGIAHGFVG
jgi:membrane protease YdiL (CAAX protease family)